MKSSTVATAVVPVIGAVLAALAVAAGCVLLTANAADDMKDAALAAIGSGGAAGGIAPSEGGADGGRDAEGAPAADDGREPSADEPASDGADGAAAATSGEAGDGVSDEGGKVKVRRVNDVYIVEWGDTLSAISAEHGVSVDKIANLNDIRDVNLIYADSVLEMPEAG